MNFLTRLFPQLVLLQFSLVFLIYFFFKVLSPGAGLIAFNQTHWSYGDYFDQAASFVVARNYSDNGFLKNYGMQDRSGISVHSRFSVPCHGETNLPPVKMKSFTGEDQDIFSLRGECVYTKAPPLVFWIYGSLIDIFDSERAVRLFGAFIHLLLFYAIFIFLRTVFGIYPAFYTMLLYGVSALFWGWAHFLYSHSFALLFTVLSFYFIHKRTSRYFPIAICSFLASFSLVDIIPLLVCYPWMLAIVSFERKKLFSALLVTFISCISLLVLFLLASSYMGGASSYFAEYLQLNNRYVFFGSYIELYQILLNVYSSELLNKTFYPFEILLFMLLSSLFLFRRSSRLRYFLSILFSLLVASFFVAVVFAEHSFYHVRAVFYFSQIFWLALVCFFFASLLFLRRKRLGHLFCIVSVFCGVIFSASNISKDFLQLLSHNKIFYKGDLSRNIIDVSLEYLPSLDQETFMMDEFWSYQATRISLIDGLYPPGPSSFIFKKKAKTTINFFFNRNYNVREISLLIKNIDVGVFLASCRIFGRDRDYNIVQYNNPTSSLFEHDLGFNWISVVGEYALNGVGIDCNSDRDFEAFELRVL